MKMFGAYQTFATMSALILATRTVDRNIIDYEVVSNWLERCIYYRSRCCHVFQRQTIPGFKVIDCETLQAIPALQGTDFTYLTPSYV